MKIYKLAYQILLLIILSFLLLVVVEKIHTSLNTDIRLLWICPIVIFIIAWKLVRFHPVLKLITICVTFVLSYYLFMFFEIQAHTYAYNKCLEAIKQKDGVLSEELSKNGFFKFHLQARECEYKLTPLPWIGTPQISDNPPGFDPVNK